MLRAEAAGLPVPAWDAAVPARSTSGLSSSNITASLNSQFALERALVAF